MSQTRTSRSIATPPEQVFDTVAHIENCSQAIPGIVDVEFLTESRSGVGTRFRETRTMRGREAKTELEVTEYEPNARIRLVSDQGGTVWDTVFTVVPGVRDPSSRRSWTPTPARSWPSSPPR